MSYMGAGSDKIKEKYFMKDLLNKNDYISLHPLLSIKLIEGLGEIVFRLRMKGKKKRLNKPENLSHFFGR